MFNFSKFYETKEDFNHVYGLSLEYLDPAVLTDKVAKEANNINVYRIAWVVAGEASIEQSGRWGT